VTRHSQPSIRSLTGASSAYCVNPDTPASVTDDDVLEGDLDGGGVGGVEQAEEEELAAGGVGHRDAGADGEENLVVAGAERRRRSETDCPGRRPARGGGEVAPVGVDVEVGDLVGEGLEGAGDLEQQVGEAAHPTPQLVCREASLRAWR
jgi:hypothetical protein